MSYEKSDIETWQWPEDATFGATGVTHQVMGPKGKVGFVRDIIVDVTTALVGTTTVPEINVGISSGDFTFGRYRLGTTAIAGYAVGMHRAGMEPITGNPPRLLADFPGHVVLDGGPLTSDGIAGGSYSTQVPAGRIPGSGPWTVTNVILGTVASSNRYFVNGMSARNAPILGQKVRVQGVNGVNATANGILTVAAVDTVNYAYVELTTQTFSGAYTNGGSIMPLVIVTCLAGVGGTPAGGGLVKVKFQWLGPDVW